MLKSFWEISEMGKELREHVISMSRDILLHAHCTMYIAYIYDVGY